MSTSSTTVVVIGGGQAGLAMSRHLSDRDVDHVVLERGQAAHSWRTERWDSLRLLSPNWLTRLPGFTYDGDDPEGYMTAGEVARFLDRYRTVIGAPVHSGTTVESVTPMDGGFRIETDQGAWRTRAVVVATGACSTPHVPALATQLPGRIQQLSPIAYRNPAMVAGSRVLVVGASASGLQIADELARSGREVVLAAGEHVRVPRIYRGMDIHWWMDAIGLLDERHDEVEDLTKARRTPSLQLVGSPEQRALDLNVLGDHGVEVVGRLVGCTETTLQFSGSLANVCASADLKQARLLDRIDDHASAHGLDPEVGEPHRPTPTRLGPCRLLADVAGIDAVVWATGFRPSYPWLDGSLLDDRGTIRHDGGVGEHPGLYVLGLPFLRRRKSSFLDGVGVDADDLATHLRSRLDGRPVVTSVDRRRRSS